MIDEVCEHCGKRPTTMHSPIAAGVALSIGDPVMWRHAWCGGVMVQYAVVRSILPSGIALWIFDDERLVQANDDGETLGIRAALVVSVDPTELRLPTREEAAAIDRLRPGIPTASDTTMDLDDPAVERALLLARRLHG